MSGAFSRHRPFLVASATSALLVGGAALVARIWGEDLVRAGHEGRLAPWWNELCHHGEPAALSLVLTDHRERFIGLLACAAGIWTLCAAVYFAARGPRPALVVPLAAIAAWLVFESWAPPYVKRLLWLKNYEIIRDVDHIEKRTGPEYNSDYLRGAPESARFRPDDLNVVFLGDSFTFGYRLKHSESFPARVGVLLGEAYAGERVRVANFGWTSSSPLLSARRLEAIGAKYSPDVVVLAIDMTDFRDDIRYRDMLARRGLYALYDKTPVALKIFETIAPDLYLTVLLATLGNPPRDRFFVTEAPLEQTRPWIEPLVTNVSRIHEWCRAHSAAFVLVVLPRSYQYSDRESPENWERDRYTVLGPYSLEPFRYFEELSPTVDYPILSLLETFQTTEVFPTCFKNDPHWTAAGAEVAARAIATRLEPVIEARLGVVR